MPERSARLAEARKRNGPPAGGCRAETRSTRPHSGRGLRRLGLLELADLLVEARDLALERSHVGRAGDAESVEQVLDLLVERLLGVLADALDPLVGAGGLDVLADLFGASLELLGPLLGALEERALLELGLEALDLLLGALLELLPALLGVLLERLPILLEVLQGALETLIG